MTRSILPLQLEQLPLLADDHADLFEVVRLQAVYFAEVASDAFLGITLMHPHLHLVSPQVEFNHKQHLLLLFLPL